MPCLTPRELTALQAGDVPDLTPFVPMPVRHRPLQGVDRDPAAARDWQAHVDAGRIGGAERGAPPGREHRLASLAAILGHD